MRFDCASVQDLGKAKGDRLLYDGVNFSLPRGGVVGIIGANGAGKVNIASIVKYVLVVVVLLMLLFLLCCSCCCWLSIVDVYDVYKYDGVVYSCCHAVPGLLFLFLWWPYRAYTCRNKVTIHILNPCREGRGFMPETLQLRCD